MIGNGLMAKYMNVIEWQDDHLVLLDQTELPNKTVYLRLYNYPEVIHAIKTLKVRGAPAIGISAAYGIVLGALSIRHQTRSAFRQSLSAIINEFAQSRPTAVNLFVAIEVMKEAASGKKADIAIRSLIAAARRIHAREEKAMAKLSKLGSHILRDGDTVLTHCNTGQLATGVSYGTGLGIIKAAVEQGKRIYVYADETRPLLQGARLTAWELMQAKMPFTLITDSMAGYFIKQGKIDCVIVGADRIAANGDTANKIGTYSLSVLAGVNKVPFYVAAPTSSIDMKIRSGAEIVIEDRGPEEITSVGGVRTAPLKVKAANPAFDVTPAKYIRAIITEKGIIEKPFTRNLKAIQREEQACQRRK
jgi:methylthioribose-1-phosphate isomerase